MLDIKNVSAEDLALLGRLFVLITARKGMPFPTEILHEQKRSISKMMDVPEDKVIELYQLLFALSVQFAETKTPIHNPIGFQFGRHNDDGT